MKILFDKYQGTGNDFVIADNRNGDYNSITNGMVKHICDRHFGIGADGFILLENAEVPQDFYMKYFNADGNISSMCGNGGRCILAFASAKDIIREKYVFGAADGLHYGIVSGNGIVSLQMQNVDAIMIKNDDHELNTGSPHYVTQVVENNITNVRDLGSAIRYSDAYKDEGINVNFVEVMDTDELFVRTYERGVENETLSCGTGVTAAALVFADDRSGIQARRIKTPGGVLQVSFVKENNNSFSDIWLEGPATFVFSELSKSEKLKGYDPVF